jgi:hypothetical protein
MKRLVVLALPVILGSAFLTAQAPKSPDPWARWNFLLGEWRGLGSGAPGEGQGGCSFGFELDKKILVRKNWAKYPPKPAESEGLSHEDLLIIYPPPEGKGFRAIYFDNEGHAIEYPLVSFPPTGEGVTLESAAGRPGPRFRLVYQLKPDGKLENFFLIAPPGGEFKPYVSGLLEKKGPAKSR